MDKRVLDEMPAASIGVMLAVIGVMLYREPTAVKSFLMRTFGTITGGALYALALAGSAVGWWALWRAANRYVLLPELEDVMRAQRTKEHAGA